MGKSYRSTIYCENCGTWRYWELSSGEIHCSVCGVMLANFYPMELDNGTDHDEEGTFGDRISKILWEESNVD